MSNLTDTQLQAIEQYRTKLESLDPVTAKKHALANYRQNLVMHNTYRSIINHHLMIESVYVQSLLGE